jgi:hypothetical protein
MSTSVAKEPYARRVAESGHKRPIPPYSWAFNLLVEWVLTDIRVGRIAHTEGVSFILESGHDNNAEAERIFQKIRRIHNLENVLRSISFVSKVSCRAIQMADLFAFYSRRHGAVMYLTPPEAKLERRDNPGTMLNIITEAIPHRAYVATDFGPDAPGTRFFGGPLEGE